MLCALSALFELRGWWTSPDLDSSLREIIGRKTIAVFTECKILVEKVFEIQLSIILSFIALEMGLLLL